MKPFEEQFTAWVDGKLEGPELAEFEKQLAEHPEAAAEKEEALRLRALLRTHPTAPRLSNPDFFNHQLMRQIEADQPRPVEQSKPGASFWAFGRLIWAGAVCLLLAFGAYKLSVSPQGSTPPPQAQNTQKASGDQPTYFAQVVEAWPSQDGISATTVYNPDDNVTVVWLDGLDYIPATVALN
jgi:anti-sigma factor RsiW